MIDLTAQQLEVINAILQQFVPGCEVRAFGSRVSGNAKPYSDLDLVVIGQKKLSLRLLGQLREAFQSSDLPFRVDVVDWHTTSESFRKIIDQNCFVLQKNEPSPSSVQSKAPENKTGLEK